jgi:cell division protein ZapA (FtsZ GTPase activity inhibitor)
MANFKQLLNQLKSATNQLTSQIADLDSQIQALHAERLMIMGAMVSKDDYMAYVERDIARKAESYRIKIRRQVSERSREYGKLRALDAKDVSLFVPYLSADPYLTELSESAIFWIFGDLIKQRLAVAIDDIEWPQEAMPVADREKELSRIDQQIASLTNSRDGLANQLLEAGLSGS